MTTEERALALRQNGAVTPYTETPEENDYGIDDSELRAPFLQWNGKLGQFLDPITGEISEAVSLVLLRRLPASRICWNPDLDSQQKMLCRSLDTVYPVDAEQAKAIGAGPTCDGCVMAQFGTDATGKLTKSRCSEYLNLAVAFADDPEPLPYLLGVKSTGLKPMRKLLQQHSWKRVAKRVKGIPGFAIRFTLSRGDAAGSGAKKYFPLAARLESEMVDESHWPGLAALHKVVSQATIDVTAEIVPDDEPESDAPDYGPERHVNTAEETEVFMDKVERERREEAAAARAARPTALPFDQPAPSEPEDDHSLPAEEPMTQWEALKRPEHVDPADLPRRSGARR